MIHWSRPIDKNRIDTYLTDDSVVPYGGRVQVSSEPKRKKIALKLLKKGKKEN